MGATQSTVLLDSEAESVGAFHDAHEREAAAAKACSADGGGAGGAKSPKSPSQRAVRKYVDAAAEPSGCAGRLDRALGFDAIDSRALVSSCFVSPTQLLCVRACMWLYAVSVTAWYVWGQTSSPARMWAALASLTGFTLLLLLSYLTGALVLTARHVCQRLERGTLAESAWLRLTYVLFEFAFTWALVAVALFWVVEWPHTRLNGAELTALIHLHGACLALSSVDLWLSRVKFEFTHFVAGALSALCVTALYTAGFGTAHTAMANANWHSFFSFLVLFAVLFGVLLSFCFAAGCTSARDLCHAYSAHHNPDVVLPHGGGGPGSDHSHSGSCAPSINGDTHSLLGGDDAHRHV